MTKEKIIPTNERKEKLYNIQNERTINKVFNTPQQNFLLDKIKNVEKNPTTFRPEKMNLSCVKTEQGNMAVQSNMAAVSDIQTKEVKCQIDTAKNGSDIKDDNPKWILLNGSNN